MGCSYRNPAGKMMKEGDLIEMDNRYWNYPRKHFGLHLVVSTRERRYCLVRGPNCSSPDCQKGTAYVSGGWAALIHRVEKKSKARKSAEKVVLSGASPLSEALSNAFGADTNLPHLIIPWAVAE